MEPRKNYTEDDSLNRDKTAAEYGNKPKKMNTDNSGDSFNEPNNGSQYLVDKYNINDQAHSDSSLDDFIKTTSGFRHADDVNPDTNFNENPGGVSAAD